MEIKKHPIYKEVYEAYYDCVDDSEDLKDSWEEIHKKRNLSFRASQAVDRITAIAIMEGIVPGYNGFETKQLTNLPEECMVTIAREGSVCIYVKGELPKSILLDLNCNEFHYDKKEDETRIWWD